MPLNQHDMIKVCEILAEQEGLKVTVHESFKGACCAFAGALVGGILGGPVGLGIGSAAGGVFAACRSQGRFKSAVHVIMYEMPETEKQRLAIAVQNVVRNIDASDVVTLVALLSSNQVLKDGVLQLIRSSLTNNMGLTLA